MFERFTETARRTIFYARYYASEFGATTIESEHLLLGLIREDKYLADILLAGSSLANIRKEIEERVTIREKVSTSIDMPLSNQSARILAYASDEAEKMNSTVVGTQHLLLGVFREEKCLAAEILETHHLNLDRLRNEFRNMPVPHWPAIKQITNAFTSGQPDETLSRFLQNPVLPEPGVVADADTAIAIAEAVWKPVYGPEVIIAQMPLNAELRYDIWIVMGSSFTAPLFAVIMQTDGRILSMGRRTE
jgi:hypothetical protein